MRITSCFHLLILSCYISFFPGCITSPSPENNIGKLHTGISSYPLTIELNLTGASYGHKLLFKSRTTGTNYHESYVAYTNGMAYMASCSTHGRGFNKIFALDTATGTIVWDRTIGPGYVGPVIDGDIIYIGNYSHETDPLNEYVYALNRFTGALKWKTKIGKKTDISSPTLARGLVFIGTRDGKKGGFFALDEKTARILWTYRVGASVTAPPSIADGMLFCVTDDFHMYVFDIGIGEGDWLLHRYDRLNTAFTPKGLIKWQYVKAECKAFEQGYICTITNFYDDTVNQVALKLQAPVNWFDDQGRQIVAKTDCLIIPRLKSLGSKTVFIRP